MTVFIPARTSIIDQIGQNFLIRGNMPLTSMDDFAFNDIENVVNMNFKNHNFMDICLIDNAGEIKSFEPEIKAFWLSLSSFPSWPPINKNYDPKILRGGTLVSRNLTRQGNFVWWPIEGIGPNQNPNDFINSGWNFSGLVDFLISLSKTEKPTAIYFHCMLGADRTGALHAGYMMKSKNMKADKAIEIVSNCGAGKPNSDYINLINKYGEYLNG